MNNGPEKDLGGLDGDEQALRRMLQGAVEDLHPTDGALDHLRRAVPARRARKRQAIVGMAAAALLFCTAVPAFVHVAGSGDTSEDHPVNAGHGEQAQGGTGEETGSGGGEAGPDSPAGNQTTGVGDGVKGDPEKPQESVAGTSDGTVGGTSAPSVSVPDTVAVCEAGQLSVSAAQADKPDAEGKVYGTFRIANVSTGDCAVAGAGKVGFTTAGAADPSKITVVDHAPGDAATGLPDQARTAQALVLKPSAAYEVKFAWVPAETCPTDGGGASPDPTAPTDGTAASGSGGTSAEGTQPQLGTEDGTPAEGSVTVTHTPEAGAPAAETTIPNACAGTIYRTGALDAS
ncbi:hypothetical protein [Streptomyces sp. SP18CS02]|uniref:hypothetical protein n=1 Tax=Streptomyces sp. SP18CS02 TaxID=3002531 RepID=UPI002E77A0A3|nr:hypothetical protein [Streptomyces sp. SP18CS02]MEE1756780.1 hypothetical protein [Streptomyces sp. SP18CS02]